MDQKNKIKRNVILDQLKQESLETLKSAKEQIIPDKKEQEGNLQEDLREGHQSSQTPVQETSQSNQVDIRRYQALQNEIEDIRKQNNIEKEQKEKKETISEQKQQEHPLVEPRPKRSRRFLSGGKLQAERQKKRVENPLPPTG